MQCHNNRKSTKTSWYYAKKTKRYREQKETQVNAYLEEIASISEGKIAYVDETGIDAYLHRMYGYALKGKLVFGKIPGRKFKRTSIVAEKLGKTLVAPMQYDGTMESTLFEY